MMKTAAIHTLGCKLNQTEAMEIRAKLEGAGYEIVSPEDKAQIFIINTCTVTAKSDAHARQFIRKTINKNPDAFILVTGCYPQISSDKIAEIKGVDVIIGILEKKNILKYIANPQKRDKPYIEVSDIMNTREFDYAKFTNFGDYTRAFVKIQDGCDSSCSFCIVRYARGPNRSANPALILNKIKNLADSGYKEVVLTGVHLGTYGNDIDGDWNLTKLLKDICSINELTKVRLSSIEPTEFTDDLIDIITHELKIAKHFHIPMQSGSERILKMMNRPYNPQFYGELINKIKASAPDAAIGADVLVGFPGEHDEDFEDTNKLIKRIPISYLHVFSYSKRPGTKAASMAEQIQPEIKKERSKTMRKLGKSIWQDFCLQYIDKEVEFLILTSRDETTGLLRGISHNYLRALIPGNDDLMNEYITCRVDSFQNGILQAFKL